MKQPPRVILLITHAREFDRALRRGITDYSHAHGPWFFCEEPPAYLSRLAPGRRPRNMRDWKADAMIVPQGRFAEVASLRIPSVVAIESRQLPATQCQILCADEQIGRMGARALIDLGLRSFAYCGLQCLQFSDRRCAGFLDAIKQSGHVARVYAPPAGSLEQAWYVEDRRLARWLRSLPKPCGLMACNDDRARTIAEICCLRGIRVPEEIAILGVDNDEQICRSAYPPLSSIALAAHRAGYEAAAHLAAMISGRSPTARIILIEPTHVAERQSTSVLAVEDPAVGRALRFARDNNHRDVRVPDLVSASGLSRRSLQDRFLRSLGRTPLQEIHRCRMERVARLLVETNLTIGEIAHACGFTDIAHVARFFSRLSGVTPTGYRQKHRG